MVVILKIELIDTHIFKDAFDSISRIVDEITIEVDSDGFRVNALDRSHITFASLNLQPSVFDEFICNVPEQICLDTIELMKILKRGKKNDILHLESDDNNLIITFIGDSTRTFKIRCIDMESNLQQLPEIKPPCKVQIMSNLMKDCLGDMELFSNVLTYELDEDYFYVKANGEFGDSDFKYLHGEEVNGYVKSSFSIDKLKDIFTASKFSDVCEIFIGNDMPVVILFRLDTGDGELKYLLAPRLSEDE